MNVNFHVAGLMEGKKGFDSSRALWKDAGWKEIREIRKMLEVTHPRSAPLPFAVLVLTGKPAARALLQACQPDYHVTVRIGFDHSS